MPYEKSPEQRAIDWGKIIETALDMPGNVGNVYNRFYNYSYTNQALLWLQGAREPVATMKRWNALGRTELSGSRAKAIREVFTATDVILKADRLAISPPEEIGGT